MIPEDMQRTMDFLLSQQAKFDAKQQIFQENIKILEQNINQLQQNQEIFQKHLIWAEKQAELDRQETHATLDALASMLRTMAIQAEADRQVMNNLIRRSDQDRLTMREFIQESDRKFWASHQELIKSSERLDEHQKILDTHQKILVNFINQKGS